MGTEAEWSTIRSEMVGAATERSRWLADQIDELRVRSELARVTPDARGEWAAEFGALWKKLRDRLRQGPDEERRAAAIYLTATHDPTSAWSRGDLVCLAVGAGGWRLESLWVLLSELLRHTPMYWSGKVLDQWLTAVAKLPESDRRALLPALRMLPKTIDDGLLGLSMRTRLVTRVTRMLSELDPHECPEGVLVPNDAWAPPLRSLLTGGRATPDLVRLVTHLATLNGPRPGARWRATCLRLAESHAARELVQAALHGLATCPPVDMTSVLVLYPGSTYRGLVSEHNAPLARGFVWAATLLGVGDLVADLTTVAVRTGETRRDHAQELKVAGAAITALGECEAAEALSSLWLLERRIRNRSLRRQLDAAIALAADRQGITRAELIERHVPTHGMGATGVLRELGDWTGTVTVADARTVALRLRGPDGRVARGVPAALRTRFPDQIAELRALRKAASATLAAERARVEELMTEERCWSYAEWARLYRDHPITGAVIRGLIWQLDIGDGDWISVLACADGLVDAAGELVAAPVDGGRVRLWHPTRVAVDEVERWRSVVDARRLAQPFRQAYREIYPITPAEELTESYSARFAGHIVTYSRFYALVKQRSWHADVLGHFDGGDESAAIRELRDGSWRARFEHARLDSDVDDHVELAETGAITFERRDGAAWSRAPLREVPPLVFSEAMRDIDLFVSLCSVASDPTWLERAGAAHERYWRATAAGELTPAARVRHAALERVVPKLAIANQCQLTDRYLVVRGRLRTYRIHIGTANVLMEPGSTYLCLVATRAGGTQPFLPFEQDGLLALILSKAMLLAADDSITDETITRQIGTETP